MDPNNAHPTLTGSEILWATLVGEGVTTVFGYPGGAILPAYDALRKFPIHHVLVRHEQGAAHMADGYARASGKVGVAIATSGPGATNLVTGIATAMLDSVPIVCITGQVSSKVLGSDAFQEIDITKDAQQGTTLFNFEDAAPAPYRPHPMLRAESAEMHRAIELIKQSKKPVILAGHGIIHSAAEREVLAFAERHQIPVATTLLGLGAFPASHPLALGMMGMHGESWVNHAIQQADLLLAFGMRFDDRVTGNLASYAPDAKKIHIEIDPSEINKNVTVDVALIGDLKEVLNTLAPLVDSTGYTLDRDNDTISFGDNVSGQRPSSETPAGIRQGGGAAGNVPGKTSDWLREINASKGSAAVRDIINLPDNGHLYAAHVINDIWQEARAAGRLDKTIIATDVGQHQMWEAQYFKHEDTRTLVTSGGLGTMGYALPAAIGAKIARPDCDVWCIAGDGGFQMTAAELSTIQQECLHINVAVINNGFLGMVRQWQEAFYDKNYSCSPILSPDFVKLAEAHGIPGAHVTKRKDVTQTVTKARTGSSAFLINFAVEKEDGVYPMIAPGAALHEMVRRPQKDPLLETAEDE